ncbi:hypothetical protein [Marinifilum sp.]|uniref:hypothetical protein n=1 Tax=Marinifilum sp. TaxID=2033137 RepID=UPI003BA8F2A8
MRKAYLFVYSDNLGTRDEVKNCMDNIPEVYTWRYDMPNSFYIISEYSADEIARAINSYTGKTRFIVSEITDNKQGWLSEDTWYLINNKTHKPKEE